MLSQHSVINDDEDDLPLFVVVVNVSYDDEEVELEPTNVLLIQLVLLRKLWEVKGLLDKDFSDVEVGVWWTVVEDGVKNEVEAVGAGAGFSLLDGAAIPGKLLFDTAWEEGTEESNEESVVEEEAGIDAFDDGDDDEGDSPNSFPDISMILKNTRLIFFCL